MDWHKSQSIRALHPSQPKNRIACRSTRRTTRPGDSLRTKKRRNSNMGPSVYVYRPFEDVPLSIKLWVISLSTENSNGWEGTHWETLTPVSFVSKQPRIRSAARKVTLPVKSVSTRISLLKRLRLRGWQSCTRPKRPLRRCFPWTLLWNIKQELTASCPGYC